MIKENQEHRRIKLDEDLKLCLYRRYKLGQEIEDLDKKIMQIEGALNENESVRRDIGSEEAINQAKKKEEESKNE